MFTGRSGFLKEFAGIFSEKDIVYSQLLFVKNNVLHTAFFKKRCLRAHNNFFEKRLPILTFEKRCMYMQCLFLLPFFYNEL